MSALTHAAKAAVCADDNKGCVQELASPELQSLAMEAKKAAALIKYMPLPAQQLPAVARIQARAPQLEPWMARGCALTYTQVPPAQAARELLHVQLCVLSRSWALLLSTHSTTRSSCLTCSPAPAYELAYVSKVDSLCKILHLLSWKVWRYCCMPHGLYMHCCPGLTLSVRSTSGSGILSFLGPRRVLRCAVASWAPCVTPNWRSR